MRKKLICGLLGLSASVCLGIGAISWAQPSISAAAAVEGISVNRLGDLEWNAVDGATSYKVSSAYGEFTVINNKANVGDAITKAAKAAYAADETATSTTVDFTVTPYTGDVAGEASTYTHTVDSYINYGFSTTDLSETQKNVDGTLVGEGTMVATNATAGVIGATYKNNLFSFGLDMNKQLSTNTGQNSYLYLFGKEDVVTHSNGTYYYNTSYSEYAWAIRFARSKYMIYLEGTENDAKYAHTTATASYVELDVLTVPTHSEDNESYALTVGVFDTYNLAGVKTGETLYILREIVDRTNNTKTFDFQNAVFVDNATLADPNGDGDTADAITEEDYEGCSGFGMRSPSDSYTYTLSSGKVEENEGSSLCEVSKVSFTDGEDKTFHWYLSNLNDVAVANLENVKARITFKGETVEQSLAETNVTGTYKISLTVPEEDYGENIAISVVLKGGQMGAVHTYTAQQCLEDIMADVNAEYDIIYVLPQGVVNSASNPSVYTTANAVVLSAPETVPAGYLFKGWYDSSDTLHQNKITEILGRIGEIELVAVIEQGYNVSIEIEGETQTIPYFVGDPAIVLSAPEIVGKKFVKWQILNGYSYQDFEATSFTPSETTILKAVYEDAIYQITYVADEATHSNPDTYTLGENVVFTAAEKEGYFFAGWYKDAAFLQRVESTAGYAQNLTLYARFIKDTVEASSTITASVTRQLVPMPVLPEGFTCATKLFVKGSTQALELEDGIYYVFSEVGTVYTLEYTVMLPTGESVVRTAELTVVAEESDEPDTTPSEDKKSPWLAISLIGGGVLLAAAGAGVGVFFYLKKKKKK